MIDSLTNTSALKVSESLPEQAYFNLLALQKKLTLDVAATASTVTQVMQHHGEPTTIKLVCAILKMFNDGLNTSLQMSPKQLFEYATIWCEEYANDTVKDLILCLKRVKAGRYGPIYNRIDGTVVSDFFRQYLLEKAEWGEQQNRQFKSDQMQTSQSLFALLPDEEKKRIDQLLKRPKVRIIPADSPLSSDRAYTDYLKEHAQDIEFELLEDIANRARKQNLQEILTITVAEIDRRNQPDDHDVSNA